MSSTKAAPKRVPLPAILLANDFASGEVLFIGQSASGALFWVRDPAKALIAFEDAVADQLEAFAAQSFGEAKVVDAYLVDVMLDAQNRPVPKHFREKFKILGPSHRPDLGKQAEFGQPALHVAEA
jgi:hypothetical protein